MSFDKLLRAMVADEVAQALRPVHAALAELRGHNGIITRLASALGQPIKRGPGVAPVKRVRECAIIDCGKPARSKGYCNNHYQKLRMLTRSRRLPSDWVPDAEPGSVKNIALPRGRAGAKGK